MRQLDELKAELSATKLKLSYASRDLDSAAEVFPVKGRRFDCSERSSLPCKLQLTLLSSLVHRGRLLDIVDYENLVCFDDKYEVDLRNIVTQGQHLNTTAILLHRFGAGSPSTPTSSANTSSGLSDRDG